MKIAGHPIHPMLIPLPIAFFLGALAADIVTKASGRGDWYFIGYVLTIAGWASGLLAAIPGLVDYFAVVPRKTRAKRDGTIHMILNVTIVGCYFASWIVKNGTGMLSWASLILEIAGCALLLVSGWYGWAMVYEHHIGIAEAREETRAHEQIGRAS